jgi:hypothetical protein
MVSLLDPGDFRLCAQNVLPLLNLDLSAKILEGGDDLLVQQRVNDIKSKLTMLLIGLEISNKVSVE